MSRSTLIEVRAGRSRPHRKNQERLAAITAIDHFNAPAADDAREALEELQTSLSPPNGASGAGEGALHREDFRGRVWVTRPRPGVDRMASAWLIRRFIAPDARFAFAAPQARVTKRQIPFVCHPPSTVLTSALELLPQRLPRPNGNW